MIDQLKAWQDHYQPGHALDLGAGDGEITVWLAQRGFAVDAVEPDPGLADALRNRLGAEAIQLHVQDALTFPFPMDRYALIVASAVLHFIESAHQLKLSQQIMNSLAPGGMLFAAAFTVDDPAAHRSDANEGTLVKHFFQCNELRKLFQPLDELYYEEFRRSAPESRFGYRSGATLIARRSRPS